MTGGPLTSIADAHSREATPAVRAHMAWVGGHGVGGVMKSDIKSFEDILPDTRLRSHRCTTSGAGIWPYPRSSIALAPTPAWPAASFAATLSYLLFAGAELAAAERLEVKITGEDAKS